MDIRLARGLGRGLTSIFAFFEHVNAECATLLMQGNGALHLPHLLIAALNRCPSRISRLEPRSSFNQVMLECGIEDHLDREAIYQAVSVLLAPARVQASSTSQTKIAQVIGEPHVGRLPVPDLMKERLYTQAGEGSLFSTRQSDTQTQFEKTSAVLWDEWIDPISAVQGYLVSVVGISEEDVPHAVQQWILWLFTIQSSSPLRFALASVCERMNKVFFDDVNPSRHILHTTRSATVSTRLILQTSQFLLCNTKALRMDPQSAMRFAAGLFLFMRVRRLVRCRYHWPAGSENISKGEEPALQSGVIPEHCATALRPIEYSYVMTIMFGMHSSIPGLDFVFRGGIVTHDDRGRVVVLQGAPGSGKTVFALQSLVDVAKKGGVSIYFSFEEGYDVILERLVTFGMLDSSTI
jgi:hypothetical protein